LGLDPWRGEGWFEDIYREYEDIDVYTGGREEE
jgi:hypothetical protein